MTRNKNSDVSCAAENGSISHAINGGDTDRAVTNALTVHYNFTPHPRGQRLSDNEICDWVITAVDVQPVSEALCSKILKPQPILRSLYIHKGN